MIILSIIKGTVTFFWHFHIFVNLELIITYIHDYAIKIQMNSNFFDIFIFWYFFGIFLFVTLKTKNP